MARRVKRLGFPDWLLNNECVISVDTEELNEVLSTRESLNRN